MHIDDYKEAVLNCRFCFMCRHLSTVGNVRFTEADTPRVRAAMMYGISTGTNRLDDEDFITTLYRQDLSACCRRHCVNHFDENGLSLAARADVVEAGFAPADVKAIAKKYTASAKWSISGSGDVAWFEDTATAAAKSVTPAFAKLAKTAGISFRTITGGSIGKALKVLGFLPEAKIAAEAFAAFLAQNGVKTLVCPNPGAFDALTKDYPAMGIQLSCDVFCTAGFLLKQKFTFKPAPEIYYLHSDFMRNYDECDCPDRFLKSMKAEIKPFGTNDEESYSCGEGAVILDKLHPELVRHMVEYVVERVDNPQKDVFVVSSPYTKRVLAKYGKLHVLTVEEFAAACL